MPDDPISERATEVVLLRREIDRDTRDRLRKIEDRIDTLEHEMAKKFQELIYQVHKLAEFEQAQKPMLDTLNSLVVRGMVLRWMIVGMVGIFATLATVATAWEAIKKWLS